MLSLTSGALCEGGELVNRPEPVESSGCDQPVLVRGGVL